MGSGDGIVELYIEPGSTIRKAYLFSYTIGYPPSVPIIINDVPFFLDTLNCIMSVSHTNPSVKPVRIHFYDFTQDLSNNITTTFNIALFDNAQPNLPANTGWWTAFLYIEYDNPFLPIVSTAIWVNDKNYIGYESYVMGGMNPFNTNYPVGLSLFIDRACNVTEDGTIVTLNNDIPLGTIGLSDTVNELSLCGGSKGHFYYQNNELFGLDDDTPDSLMGGSDALADIASYLMNGATSYSINLAHQLYPLTNSAAPNLNLLFFNTYTSPCEAFEASVTENIQACKNQPTQLHATGGNAYQWQPQVDLSCYDCPNPVFMGDTSRFYTCRIWNTDSCSKVLPVKVNVLPQPIVPAFSITPSQCYGNTGEIKINNSPAGFTYSLNGSTPQTQTLFNDLAEGYHLLTVTDSNGCTSDTTVYVAEVNTTVAQFSVNPQSGYLPLEVTLTNQSQNATNYIWYIGNDTIQTTSTAPFTHTFNTEGNFDIALVAYHTLEACSDTSYLNITTEYPFTVIIPTLYGGYMDGSPYRIYTSGLSSLQYKLYSNDGRLVRILEATPAAGYLNLWESRDIAAGLYIYHIRAIAEDGTEKIITGKLVVV